LVIFTSVGVSAVQGSEVHAACRAEADGEHADAVGTDT